MSSKRRHRTARRLRNMLGLVIFIGLLGAVAFGWRSHFGSEPLSTLAKQAKSSVSSVKQVGKPPKQASFDKAAHSLTDPSSIWVVVNKKRPLTPTSYAPNDLRSPNIPLRLTQGNQEMLLRAEVANALEAMATGAKKENIELMLSSGYRSYTFQKDLYARYVRTQGQSIADTQSARAGYSEHQTGLAADLEPANRQCEVAACFADTPEGKWLAAHAPNYGFVVRYPQGLDATTGYIYEPWHVRYVGKALAAELQKANIPTLEDFFGLEKAAKY